MSEVPIARFIGTALIVCDDAVATRQITEALQDLALGVEVCITSAAAVDRVYHRKVEVAVVDFALGGTSFIELLRSSPSNRTVVTLAITGSSEETARSLKTAASFALQRPLTPESIKHTLRAAYGLIVRERRRYYRHPVSVAAVLSAKNGPEIFGKTVNVSETGMAFESAGATLVPGTVMNVQFRLEDRLTIRAECKVCWANDKGQAGLAFLFLPSTLSSELQSWLARKLEEQLPSTVSRQFQPVG